MRRLRMRRIMLESSTKQCKDVRSKCGISPTRARANGSTSPFSKRRCARIPNTSRSCTIGRRRMMAVRRSIPKSSATAKITKRRRARSSSSQSSASTSKSTQASSRRATLWPSKTTGPTKSQKSLPSATRQSISTRKTPRS